MFIDTKKELVFNIKMEINLPNEVEHLMGIGRVCAVPHYFHGHINKIIHIP